MGEFVGGGGGEAQRETNLVAEDGGAGVEVVDVAENSGEKFIAVVGGFVVF